MNARYRLAAQLMIACLRLLGFVLPTRIFYRFVDKGVGWGLGRFSPTYWAVPDLKGLEPSIPTVLAEAARRCGGYAVIESRLRRNDRAAITLSVVYLTMPTRRRATVATSSNIQLLTSADKRPIFLVCPHLGPFPFLYVYLSQVGIPLSVVGVVDARGVGITRELYELLPHRNATPINHISAFSTVAPFEVQRALQSGHVVAWLPDSPLALKDSKRGIPVDFMDTRYLMSPVMVRVALRTNARVIAATVRHDNDTSAQARFDFMEIELGDVADLAGCLRTTMAEVQRLILQRPCEWNGWRYSAFFTGNAATN